MHSEAAEATVVVVAAALAAEAVVMAAELAEVMAVVMAEASVEVMAATDMAASGAAIGAAGALDWASDGAGRGIGPVTRMDTLTIMDIPPPTDIRVITDTIRMLIADSKHTDHPLLIKRHLLPTAAQWHSHVRQRPRRLRPVAILTHRLSHPRLTHTLPRTASGIASGSETWR